MCKLQQLQVVGIIREAVNEWTQRSAYLKWTSATCTHVRSAVALVTYLDSLAHIKGTFSSLQMPLQSKKKKIVSESLWFASYWEANLFHHICWAFKKQTKMMTHFTGKQDQDQGYGIQQIWTVRWKKTGLAVETSGSKYSSFSGATDSNLKQLRLSPSPFEGR